MNYNPNPQTAATLERGIELVRSVPYKVSARWVFYRLLQEGFYDDKSDYKNKWIKASSRARHAFYGGWRPDTLSDETREAIYRGGGYKNEQQYIDRLSEGLSCSLDKWYSQNAYVELWYEARAMSDQFRHYTRFITLRPMGGQPSIPYKWQTAKDLERAYQKYKNDITILYFGDLDPAGETISEVVERDVSGWCSVPFDFVRCGLTEDQVDEWNVPENPEKPGQYQWEALSDEGAEDVITSNTSQYIDEDLIDDVVTIEDELEEFVEEYMKSILPEWEDHKLGRE